MYIVFFLKETYDLERALSTESCAFCRLVRATIDNVFGSDFDVMPRKHEGKPTMLSVMPFPGMLGPAKPRQLILHLRPSPWTNDAQSERRFEIQLVNQNAFLQHNSVGRVLYLVKVNNFVALY